MLQFLSSFELGSLQPCFHDSLTIIDPSYTLTPKIRGGTHNTYPIAEYITVTDIYSRTCRFVTLTVNGNVYDDRKLISTRGIYVTQFDSDLLFINDDGLMKFGQETHQLHVPHGIRYIHRGYNSGVCCLLIRTMDNHLYIVRERMYGKPVTVSKRLPFGSVSTLTTAKEKWYLYVFKDRTTFECYRPR